MEVTMVLVSSSSVRSFPRNRSRKFTHDNDETSTIYDDKASNRPKSGLTIAVNTGRLDEAINNLRAFGATSDHARQEYVSFIVVPALQEEKSL